MLIELLMMAAAKAAPARLPPVDQCSCEPGFKAFHSSLKSAVAKRDGDAFLKLLAPDVLVNFGGENGKAAFATQWEVKSRTSPLWATTTFKRVGSATIAASGARDISFEPPSLHCLAIIWAPV